MYISGIKAIPRVITFYTSSTMFTIISIIISFIPTSKDSSFIFPKRRSQNPRKSILLSPFITVPRWLRSKDRYVPKKEIGEYFHQWSRVRDILTDEGERRH